MKTESELIAMAKPELKVHADCPDGMTISISAMASPEPAGPGRQDNAGKSRQHMRAFNDEVQIPQLGLRPVCLLSGPLRGLLNPSGRE